MGSPRFNYLLIRSLSNECHQRSRSDIWLGWIFQVSFIDYQLTGLPFGIYGNFSRFHFTVYP